MARAWHGRAVARGRVASGRAESSKCTDSRVGLIGPLHAQGSHVILVIHILILVSRCESVRIAPTLLLVLYPFPIPSLCVYVSQQQFSEISMPKCTYTCLRSVVHLLPTSN